MLWYLLRRFDVEIINEISYHLYKAVIVEKQRDGVKNSLESNHSEPDIQRYEN